jgi:hypothetical protein
MTWTKERVIDELYRTIGDLGKDGGYITPSVYDTAQLLRWYPPAEGVDAGLDWLLSQQKADGGWGDPVTPAARDIPTLAAILAIHTYRNDSVAQEAVQAGVAFLAEQAEQWRTVHIDAIPIAAEMILPQLLNDAAAMGFEFDREPYKILFRLNEIKVRRLQKLSVTAGTAPTYSWEAYGQDADPAVVDSLGSVGHSPAATAFWLRQAKSEPGLAELRAQAVAYLARAQKATHLNIPGVVPVVYPITGFELAYGLYTLYSAGILEQPSLAKVVDAKIVELWDHTRHRQGTSFGSTFVPDVDNTAVAVSVLCSTKHDVDPNWILQFHKGNHFFTYHHELNPSVFSNAHALHALEQLRCRFRAAELFILQRQLSDGRWIADKWHSSWRYTTLEVLISLCSLGDVDNLQRAQGAILRNQRTDGSWTLSSTPSLLETVYSVVALHTFERYQMLTQQGLEQLRRAETWLLEQHVAVHQGGEMRWLAKENYSPIRVDYLYQLSTLLACLTREETIPASELVGVRIGV